MSDRVDKLIYNLGISGFEGYVMKSLCALSVAVLFFASLCFGQASATAQSTTGHGAFPVKVTKTLDSSKLKEGDALELETVGSFKLPDGTLVPKGSKLTGHIAAAKARSKGDSDSELALAFDKLSIQGGKQLALKGTVQAVFPPAEEVDPGVPGSSTRQGAGGLGAGAGHFPAPDYKPTIDIKTGVSDQYKSGAQTADPKSVGVQGIDNLQLDNGVLTSKGKNVKLGGGVRMIVRVEIFS